ncbi:AAA family ATPase [Pelagibacterales bacterium SAG-MED47]|nr:AAA family ATPase [Pelagibacterales bacterium SAG-MED47]
MYIQPINQMRLFGLDKFFKELINLYNNKKLPNKILLSGQKGLGKSTLAYHLINYVLSEDEDFKYDIINLKINDANQSFKTVLNKSNPNFILIDINLEKKTIDINQIRDLISNLNKSSFNSKPRFVLIDNIEFLNKNSLNALLKILEEPSSNIYFILINNNKRILSTLISRCINFKISLSNKENLKIADNLLEGKLIEYINSDLINYYSSPGAVYNLVQFGINNKYDLEKLNLKNLLKKMIHNKDYKKNNSTKLLLFEFIEFYFNKINTSLKITEKYSFFIKRIYEIKKFNLDEESLFIEFKDKILNE